MNSPRIIVTFTTILSYFIYIKPTSLNLYIPEVFARTGEVYDVKRVEHDKGPGPITKIYLNLIDMKNC